MNIKMLIFAIVASVSISVFAQVAGAPGRTNGNLGVHGSFSIGGGPEVSCSGTTCSGTGTPFSPGSQVMAGTIHFTATTDASLNAGGASGGGAGLFQVSCDGGSSWLTIVGCSVTIGGGPGTCSPPSNPTCSGPTNASTLQFRSTVNGGGPTSINMNFFPPSSASATW